MSIGTVFPCEWVTIEDRLTGLPVMRLTNALCHSHHVYFTNPSWYQGGRKMLISSDRTGATNLFGIDLESGELTQLTNLARDDSQQFLCVSVNPKRDEAYAWIGRTVTAIDLGNFRHRALYTASAGYRPSMLNCTSDGRYVCLIEWEDLSGRIRMELNRGYIGMDAVWQARPHGRIVKVDCETGESHCVFEEKYWLGHCNTSLTQPNLLTFCHEGPWAKVDQRIWCLDHEIGKVHPVLPKRHPEERVGHEYWFRDGVRIGYHGTAPGREPFIGFIGFDNTGQVEVEFPWGNSHIQSNDEMLIVGDDRTVVQVFAWNGSGYDQPRLVCEHRSSTHIQQVHVHPILSPDARYVYYTTDHTGYGQVYRVELAAIDRLPYVADVDTGRG